MNSTMIQPPQPMYGVQPAFPPTGPIYAPQTPPPPPQDPFQLSTPLPPSRRKEREQVAWFEYLTTIFMDVGADWAVTDLNRDIFRQYQTSESSSKPARFFRRLADRLANKAERFKVKVKKALGMDQRVKTIFINLKAGRVVDAYSKIVQQRYQQNLSDDLVKMIVATRMIVADAVNRRSIIRFWSPAFGLTARQKLTVLDYFDRLIDQRCYNDVPQLTGVPYADAIRLRLLSTLNRPYHNYLQSAMDLPGDEVAMARLASAFATGQLCGAGDIRQSFQSWFTTPRLPQYARFFSRASNLCQGDLVWRNYQDYCQRAGGNGNALPLALLLSSGCPQSVNIEPTSRMERLFWAQLWIGDCQNARQSLMQLRSHLGAALLEHPSITIRYNYLVKSFEQCRASERQELFNTSPVFTRVSTLLQFGHYGDAMMEWHMFQSANCRQPAPMADDLELMIRLANNPRAIYTPCLTGSLLTQDAMVNLEILRKADKYAASSRPGGGRFMASLLGSVRSEPAIRLRMKAAMIAGQLPLARELARLLPRDQEAMEISACAALCQSRYEGCHALKKYKKLQKRSSIQSNAVRLGLAISEGVCNNVSVVSYDPISIKYDLQLSVEDRLAKIARQLRRADLRSRFIDPRTGTWLGRLFRRGHELYHNINNIVNPSQIMSMPMAPGLTGDLTVLPVLDQYGQSSALPTSAYTQPFQPPVTMAPMPGMGMPQQSPYGTQYTTYSREYTTPYNMPSQYGYSGPAGFNQRRVMY